MLAVVIVQRNVGAGEMRCGYYLDVSPLPRGRARRQLRTCIQERNGNADKQVKETSLMYFLCLWRAVVEW
jgi:hypothetical protein